MKQITWNPAWVNPFESAWSIFEKIKYANALTSRDFSNEYIIKIINRSYNGLHKYLSEFNKYNLENITQAIGLNPYEHTNLYMKQLIGMFPNQKDAAFLIRPDHTFCEECLSMGHHSLFHQFGLLHKCPYHLSNLKNICNSCGKKTPFNSLNKKSNGGFECSCSNHFVSIKFNTLSDWKSNLPIKDELLLKWLSMSANESAKFRNTFLYFPSLASDPNSIIFLLNYSLQDNPTLTQL
ncbi:hypothetical protein [Paenibacillus sp. Soil724D2]|uniref:hypothetical protein n=1 Tax=Paenibacillus sp. (strain Soil724D2) TaxID=1736392 RepID=UPI000715CE6C|nr:hypothetical protein [Paenibacillus sp. Soil724D2]KRE36555.1 hypothetical protein ASG85_10390 [Paenibacillus sp. Soil724D2]